MTRIIAVANQKGGVGKTTSCVNIAAALALAERRVLLVDLDPQGNASTGCGFDKSELEYSSCDVLLGDAAIEQAALEIPAAGFHIVAANSDLTAAEVGLMNAPLRERRLRLALENIAGQYDYVFIDCPPSLNMLTVNALVAAQGVLIPMQCEYYAMEGLTALLNTIEKIRGALNSDLRVEGLLRTMYDGRNNLSNEVSSQLGRHFGDALYQTVVPRNVRLAEAPSYGLPVLLYDRTSSGARAYLEVASEMERRANNRPAAATG